MMKADAKAWSVRPRPKRRLRHLVARGAPLAVWVAAIVAALQVHQHIGVGMRILGFAEDASVTIAHLKPGTVSRILVQEHEIVEQGQLLVMMDVTEERRIQATIEKDIERLRAEVEAEAARIAVDNARADNDRNDLLRQFLIDREAAHIEYLMQVMANARDKAQLRGEEVEFDIVQKLHDRGDAALRELNEVETRARALREQVEKNSVVLTEKKQAFIEADLRWHAFREQDPVATPFDPIITPLRLAAEVREAELNEVHQRIDAHALRAPVAGRITTISARPGDQLLAGAPLLSISALQTDRGVAYLAENDIFSARPGDRVVVQRLAKGGMEGEEERVSYEGVILSMSSAVTEAPRRFRTSPTWPVWGRHVIVALDRKVLLPGEAIAILRATE